MSKSIEKRLVFAAYTRCPCGAGMAYDPTKFPKQSYWDCSDIILGKAVPKGQPGWVTHEGQLPFAFYEIKSEDQPSANGATTRRNLREIELENVLPRIKIKN